MISSRLVEQLDFYPGGYPVASAATARASIALRTAPPPADQLQLEFEVDLLRASGARGRAVRRRQGQRRARVPAQLLRAAPAADHRRHRRSRTPTTSCGSTTASAISCASRCSSSARATARGRAVDRRRRHHRHAVGRACDYAFDQVILRARVAARSRSSTLRWSAHGRPVARSTSAARARAKPSIGTDTRRAAPRPAARGALCAEPAAADHARLRAERVHLRRARARRRASASCPAFRRRASTGETIAFERSAVGARARALPRAGVCARGASS